MFIIVNEVLVVSISCRLIALTLEVSSARSHGANFVPVLRSRNPRGHNPTSKETPGAASVVPPEDLEPRCFSLEEQPLA